MLPGRARFVFFNDTATTEIYTLSLRDALPISLPYHPALHARGPGLQRGSAWALPPWAPQTPRSGFAGRRAGLDRKSTRLNSSPANISYAVFCLKKQHSIAHPCAVVSREVRIPD